MACSCVGVKDYGEKSQAKEVVEEYFRWKKWTKKNFKWFFKSLNFTCFLHSLIVVLYLHHQTLPLQTYSPFLITHT
jgi:hypothetical protein